MSNGVLIFKGMKVGFLPGDLSIKLASDGSISSTAILSTSYNVLALWLRIAYDNNELAKVASSKLAAKWNDDAEEQRKLLLAELAPATQVFVSSSIAIDALYDLLRPYAKVSVADTNSWRKNRTSRAAQVSEIVRRVFHLSNDISKEIKKSLSEIYKFRDLAVHPTHELKNAVSRPDVPVGLDWRFVAYRSENSTRCYLNIMKFITHLYDKSPTSDVAKMYNDQVIEPLIEHGLLQRP